MERMTVFAVFPRNGWVPADFVGHLFSLGPSARMLAASGRAEVRQRSLPLERWGRLLGFAIFPVRGPIVVREGGFRTSGLAQFRAALQGPARRRSFGKSRR